MPGDQHVWHRPWLWDAYYAVVLAATLLIVLTTSDPVATRTAAAISLAAAALLYVLAGRPAIAGDRDTRMATLYVICLVALVVIAQTQVYASSWVLFAACPQCYMALTPVRSTTRSPRGSPAS